MHILFALLVLNQLSDSVGYHSDAHHVVSKRSSVSAISQNGSRFTAFCQDLLYCCVPIVILDVVLWDLCRSGAQA